MRSRPPGTLERMNGWGERPYKTLKKRQQPEDLIRFDFTNADGQPDSKMITHDEMRQRYADLLASNALSYRTGGGVPDENELWSVLEAATEAMNRKALPGAYISLAWNGGAEFITKRRVRAQLATQQPPEPSTEVKRSRLYEIAEYLRGIGNTADASHVENCAVAMQSLRDEYREFTRQPIDSEGGHHD